MRAFVYRTVRLFAGNINDHKRNSQPRTTITAVNSRISYNLVRKQSLIVEFKKKMMENPICLLVILFVDERSFYRGGTFYQVYAQSSK